MELRSSRVLKKETTDVDVDFGDEKKPSLSSDKSQKGASEVEIRVCVDSADVALESGWINGRTVNMDDKALFLESEALNPIKDLVVSCPEDECSERNRSVSMNLSDTDPDFKEEIKSPDEDVMECENKSENVDYGKVVDDAADDDDKDVSVAILNESCFLNADDGTDKSSRRKRKGRRGRKKKYAGKHEDKAHVGSSGECIVKRKQGRKRKNVEGSEGNGDAGAKKSGVPVSGRVLRSRTMTGSGGGKVVGGGLSRTVMGLKRKTRPELETDSGRPKKKLKRRGRPPKVQVETMPENSQRKKKLKKRGRPRKVQVETVPVKKIERRGRPRKVPYETPPVLVRRRGRPRKDSMLVKLKRRGRGRPPKLQAKNIATHVIKMRTVKLMAVKKSKKTGRKIRKTLKRVSEVTSDDELMVEDTGGEQLEARKMERRQEKQLVRDQIVGILLNAGWTIDRRPRPERVYKDAVYIDPKGRTHWSVTKAYSMLKKKIEDGDADSNEVAAFTPIPEEEMSILFRFVSKVRSDKKMKKIVVTGKKRKASKTKIIRNSAGRFGNKPSNIKMRRDTSQYERREGNQSRKPCLLARSSEKGSDQDNDGGLIYSRKRNLLTWLIDSGAVLPGWKVQYGKTRRQKWSSEGTISGDGINCGCCNEVMGVSTFVAHAGGKPGQPFDKVYLESGMSLRTCLTDSWRREEDSNSVGFNLVDVKGEDPNDDTCNICGDGGNLICCDSCPSTFHQSCLDIQNFPSGDWNCIYCSCKFCRVVSVSDTQINNDNVEMLSCCLCEEKFHRSCLQEAEAVTDSGKQSFCGTKCQELFERLQTYLGVKFELEEGFSWTLLQRSEISQHSSLHDTRLKVERNSKLAVAFSVMDECFVPVLDERSETNIIRNVVYNCGSNFRRLNYGGFFTAILEKGDEFVSAASIRIHGHRLAEMPFIGTRHIYRRQGMCRRLLDAIESALGSIGVEELVIPAIPELLQTWTKVFGFKPLDESMRQATKMMSMIVFPGVDMLQKPLFQNQPSPSPSTDCKQTADNLVDYEQTEEPPVVMDGCSCSDEDTTCLETGKSTTVHDANGLCDLNFPVKDVTGPVLPDAKSEVPMQHIVSDSDVLTDDDRVAAFVKREQHPSTESFLDRGFHRSPELQLGIENDGVVVVKASPKMVLKNTFDLNLHPTVVDTEMHIDSPPGELEVCTKSFKLSDSTSQVDNGPDPKPRDAQPLVVL